MKKLLAISALLFASASFAQTVTLENEILGSGQPGQTVPEVVVPVNIREGIYHGQQYMPGYPTAGVIWARVIEVPCMKVSTGLKCDGYTWKPAFGRAEYLFVKPMVTTVAVPETVVVEVPVVVLKEVQVKKKKE